MGTKEDVRAGRKLRSVSALIGLLGLGLLLSGCSGGDGNNSSSHTRSLATGSWGGQQSNTGTLVWPATLTVTTNGGQMTIACQGPAQYTGPVTLDSSGHFSVIGTSTPCCTNQTVPTRFDGTVVNNVLTLTLTNTNTGNTLGTYVIILGQAAPAQQGFCPG